MEKVKHKIFSLDGDTIEIKFQYDADFDVWHGDYPDFIEKPRYTPGGRPWVAATKDDCLLATGEYGDCGGCIYLKKQDEFDLIGICVNDEMKTTIGYEEAKAK